jgi:hypothetical protein
LERWYKNDDTIMSKILKVLYNTDVELSYNELKENIKYEGDDQSFISYIASGLGKRCKFGKVWKAKRGYVKLNVNIRNYINDNFN